jgi:hypothetical protein
MNSVAVLELLAVLTSSELVKPSALSAPPVVLEGM